MLFELLEANEVYCDMIIEDATYDACMAGGEEAIKIFEQYVELLESGEEVDEKAEEELSESFYNYVENAASYYTGLFEYVAQVDRMLKNAKPLPNKDDEKGFMGKMRKGLRGFTGAMKKGYEKAKGSKMTGKFSAAKAGLGRRLASAKAGAKLGYQAYKSVKAAKKALRDAYATKSPGKKQGSFISSGLSRLKRNKKAAAKA